MPEQPFTPGVAVGRSKPLSRKEREVERTRRDILEAAARSFARKGFHATTMEHIAVESGYAASSLYTYFKGKDDIYQSLLRVIADEFATTFAEPVLPELDFRARFEWLLRRQFSLAEERREFLVMFAASQSTLPGQPLGDGASPEREHYSRFVQLMAELLQRGIDEGALRGNDATDFAHWVVATTNVTCFRWVSGEIEGSLCDQVPGLMDFIFRGIGQAETKAAKETETETETEAAKGNKESKQT
jgi:AcrR family transcriptional regulator